ncbi:hypothetical protein JYK22_26145, partial [Nonomuraea sp. RK-328]|nr:hypothetical protein [Nonomuraea sp. RK-328]
MRRFRRYLEERSATGELAAEDDAHGLIDPETGKPRKFAYPPNLVVVDGAGPQAAAAQRALDELGIDDVAVCGLAKRLEEVWLPGDDQPVIMPRSSEGLYLLQRVRDEAHRFAITYHRSKRSKTVKESALDGVPGLGPARRQALLRHFGSVKRLREATVAEICEVPGIGRSTAEVIASTLKGESTVTTSEAAPARRAAGAGGPNGADDPDGAEDASDAPAVTAPGEAAGPDRPSGRTE